MRVWAFFAFYTYSKLQIWIFELKIKRIYKGFRGRKKRKKRTKKIAKKMQPLKPLVKSILSSQMNFVTDLVFFVFLKKVENAGLSIPKIANIHFYMAFHEIFWCFRVNNSVKSILTNYLEWLQITRTKIYPQTRLKPL